MEMRYLYIVFLLFLCLFGGVSAKVEASDSNLAFCGKGNQISTHLGVSFYGGGLEELFLAGAQYSQPNEFFRLTGRRSVELMTARGSGELSKYNQLLIFGFAQDAIFPLSSSVYAGINLGIYIKSDVTDRISSKFTFGERVFLGVRIFDGV